MRNLESIVFINGKVVNFRLRLDPGVWIFDDRKIEINTYFDKDNVVVDELEDYTQKAAGTLAKRNP